MQEQKKETTMKCSVKGCTSTGEQRMFRFPMDDRCTKWLGACGKPELSALPMEKLRARAVCMLHFEAKYILPKKLSRTAIPTSHLPEPAACSVRQEEVTTEMEIAEEEECQPQCDVACGPPEYIAHPGSSRDLTYTMERGLILQDEKPLQNSGNILKLLKNSTLKRPLKQKLYNAVAALKKEANQCKRQWLGLKQRIEKIEHLVHVGVCQVLENLPTPLHKMISAQMRNEGKSKRKKIQ